MNQNKIDPLVKSLTLSQLFDDVRQFSNLLENRSTEHQIHKFLSNHSYFFNYHLRLFDSFPLLSKIKLGSDHEIDFAICDFGSSGPEWKFVEIESPRYSLFNKNGDPSAELNHAIRQASDWLSWVSNNVDYARKMFNLIEYPLCLIFAGRRSELTSDTAKRLKQINYQYRSSIQIHSLDNFIDGALSVVNLIQREGSAEWALPMKALNHKKWMKAKQEMDFSNFDIYKKRPRLFKQEMKELLKEREKAYQHFQDTYDITEF